MPITFAIAGLFLFQLLGELLVRWLMLPLPGPLAGMILLFFSLVLYKKVPPALEQTASFLLHHLMLLFIPAVSGVMLYFGRIKQDALPFFASGIFATLITMMVTAYVLSFLLKAKKTKNKNECDR